MMLFITPEKANEVLWERLRCSVRDNLHKKLGHGTRAIMHVEQTLTFIK